MTRLGDVCAIRYGKDHKKLSGGSVPTYGSGGIMRYVDTAICEQPSVLIPRKGTLGNLFYTDEPFWTVDTLFWTDIDQTKIVPKYLYYQLKQKDLASYNVGTAVPSLTVEVLNEIDLDVPSIDKQRRIVEVLNSFDSKIALNNQLNDYLLDLLKSSAKNLYLKHEKNIQEKLPSGWRWVSIGEIADMVCRGIAPKYSLESDEIILGQTCIRNNLVLTENGRSHAPKKLTDKWLRKYDLLINSTGVGSLGRTAQVWFEPSKLVVDSHVTIVRATDKKNALYLGSWAFEHERYIESLHTGSTGQTELPRDRVKAIRVVLPDAGTLDEFNAIAEPSVKMIVANQEENKRLIEIRDTLLPKLMSGEIDVSKVDLMQLTNNHLADC